MSIHSTAVIAPGASIGGGVSVGPYAVIGSEVRLEDRVRVASHVVIEGRTRIGPDSEVFPFAMVGARPGHLHDLGEGTELLIGARVVIRESASLHRGSREGGGKTVIGDDCTIFAHAHVAHDCVLEAGVLLLNGAMLGGHVHVGAYVNVGGKVGIHQYCRIGTMAMVGGGAGVRVDVPPYCKASGEGPRLFGLNEIGLERGGVTADAVKALRKAYRTVFRSTLARDKALARIRNDHADVKEVLHFADFIADAKRGIARHGRNGE